MDIEHARTFLAVVAAGNFVGAAERLHVTQSTVSSRIQSLEGQLGVRLFTRGRGGAELTAAGRRFLRHAKALVRTLEQARHEVSLPSGFSGSLTLSGRIALWEDFLPLWADWMRREVPDVSLRLEIGFEEGIMQGLVQGTIDIGVMYTPESRPGLAVERLFDESLVLVSSDPARPWPDPNYIHVDWGAEFHTQFGSRFPDLDTSARVVNIGWLGLQLIQAYGGSGYFPERMVRAAIEQGRLWRMDERPLIRLPAYMVYPQDRSDPAFIRAIEKLREMGAEERAR
ncbi:DNA-binding transcriptional LysR family regulator [Sulfuritortus calidifontis]|uniref:DNA-binding transcriptional LysR family regulator n=1 Tax=Sulfuritortus calidifontis TaxID=1914471 RepID=A0A4R3JWZ9_9PROT|nr:LysR family transcriptional regulator [Sulfuritortus calidifontis]TCS71762.1 DNA-binding transcriptional LysR family regulator [Sulfuritortus calidifontis]